MCIIVQIENVISNYFALNKEQESVSLSRLGQLKEKIENCFREKHRFVLINYTNSSLINAITANSDLYKLNNDEIFLNKEKHQLIEQDFDFFNSKLPRSIKDDYLKIFREVNQSY